MKTLWTPAAVLMLLAAPVQAASGPFFSLHNTNFVVLIAFLVFLAVLVYFKVPGLVAGSLDSRAAGIRKELDEARALKEEAQALLASYERKSREMQDHADRIVAHAKADAELMAEQAKAELERSMARRLAAADDQIASAEAAAVKQVRDQAISVAVAAAGDVIAKALQDTDRATLVDDAIKTVEQRLH